MEKIHYDIDQKIKINVKLFTRNAIVSSFSDNCKTCSINLFKGWIKEILLHKWWRVYEHCIETLNAALLKTFLKYTLIL